MAPHLGVAETVFLARAISTGFGCVDRGALFQRARRLIADHRFPLQADGLVGNLSPAGRQLVEICRAMQNGTSLLIFDEPTSSLSESESREVFTIVRTLRARGTAVIYITPPIHELPSIASRLTLLPHLQ